MTATRNGALPAEVPGAAAYYLQLGMIPVPVAFRGKEPVHRAWQESRPTPADLDCLFPNGARLNLGLMLGAPSGGLVDVDLDSDQALSAAAELLPATGWV